VKQCQPTDASFHFIGLLSRLCNAVPSAQTPSVSHLQRKCRKVNLRSAQAGRDKIGKIEIVTHRPWGADMGIFFYDSIPLVQKPVHRP
jgi:hypothetical protein